MLYPYIVKNMQCVGNTQLCKPANTISMVIIASTRAEYVFASRGSNIKLANVKKYK